MLQEVSLFRYCSQRYSRQTKTQEVHHEPGGPYLADQAPDSHLIAFAGRCSLAFHNEASRTRSFYAPSPTTIIYTANDVHPNDMVVVKCIVVNLDRSFYMISGGMEQVGRGE